MTKYDLIRSNRKTLALHVRNGRLEVRAPLKCPKTEIDRFIASKEKWITGKLARSSEQLYRRETFSLGYGSQILYRGEEYPIMPMDGNRIGFDGERFYMPPDLSAKQVKAACVRIYRLLAKRYLTRRVLEFAVRMSVIPAAVKVSGAKARWASCSARRSLNFSWRLMMAADDVIDYVIVHELAHITEMNHSRRFWAIVENVMPDYKERSGRLRELRERLAGEDWGN